MNSEHWLTKTWRPVVGYSFAISIPGLYFVLPLLHVAVPAVPDTAWLVYGGVLGAASYMRGKKQVAEAENAKSDS